MTIRRAVLPLDVQCRYAKLPVPVLEHTFAKPERRWRFDYCWPDARLALEVNGAIYVQGRHARGAGLERDYEKLNEAQLRGWRVLQVTPKAIANGDALALIARALGQD